MDANPTRLQPAVAAALARWHDMIERNDLGGLDALVHPEAVFRSPMAFKPYASAQAVTLILRTVATVFQGFTYHRQLASDDGLNVMLEFSATVTGAQGPKQLKGIDLIRFDADGRIVDFEVMVRPASGLQALGEQMALRLAAVLPAFKQG